MNTTLDYDDGYTTVMEEPPIAAGASEPFMRESVRDALTRKITYLTAAELIAEPGFPQKARLPQTLPPPFNNHGHFLLLDYKLLLLILWQVIREIKSAASSWNFKRRIIQFSSMVGASLYALMAYHSELREAAWFAPLVLAVFYYMGVKVLALKPLAPQIAKIRARALQDLISNKPFLTVHDKVYAEITRNLARVGDGVLNGAKMPVVINWDGGYPFPGYGKLLYDQIFVCAPKKEAKNNFSGLTQLREAVQALAKGFVKESGVRNVSFGEVLVVHGDSLFMDSPLLVAQRNGERVPPLWYEKRNGHYLDAHTDKASHRVYFAVQVLFAQQMTLATFFIRPFMAGNAVGYQLAVVTLGPPHQNVEGILEKLLKHQQEKSKRKLLDFSEPVHDEGITFLRAVRKWRRAGSPFQSAPIDLAALKKLAISERERNDEEELYDEEIEKLSRECILWPGRHTALRNWRETHSLPITEDFFGKPEARATVVTLYSQVSKAILKGLDTLGFDISDYVDKEGRFIVHAEKIDQLISGEVVNVAQNGKAGHSNGVPKPESGKGKSAKKKQRNE